MKRTSLWVLLGTVIGMFAIGPVVGGDESASKELPALCEKARLAYVFISGGSGVIITPDGLMLTNSHVIEKRRDFDVRTGTGRHFKAKVLGHDPLGDLAVLQLQLKDGEKVPYMELGDSEALQVGDPALAVGNPFAIGFVDQSPTFTAGIVSGLHQLQGRYTECIVTDAEINPGNSGGPLVNRDGQVVGINGQIRTRWGLRSNTGLGFAISARQIKIWLPRLIAANGEAIVHGRFAGVEFQSAPVFSPQSLVVKSVGASTPAAAAGFVSGDVIQRWDGQAVPNAIRLASIMGMYPADHEVTVDVRRGEQSASLKLKMVASKRSPIGLKVAMPEENSLHVRVAEVDKESSAARAGMMVGDEILEIEGNRLDQPLALQYRILEEWLKRGGLVHDSLRLKIARKGEDGQTQEVELTIVIADSQLAKPEDPESIEDDPASLP